MTLDEQIDFFVISVRERLLDVADRLGEQFSMSRGNEVDSRSGFAILAIVFGYFEMYEQFSTGKISDGKNGNPKASESFVKGFLKVMDNPSIDAKLAQQIYDSIRCGMYHSMFLKKYFVITRDIACPLEIQHGSVLAINPAALTKHLIDHFDGYCRKLRDPQDPDSAPSHFQFVAKQLRSTAPFQVASTITTSSTTPGTDAGWLRNPTGDPAQVGYENTLHRSSGETCEGSEPDGPC